jgi:hypothetical protein
VEATSERADLALLDAISEELGRMRAAWERMTDPGARREAVARLRDLRAEREQLRSRLPSAPFPPLESGHPSEDPEDLREQADAARDAEDKVRQQLRALEKRIAEAREEKELDRRMSEFLGDEYMFDEHDRRLRLGSSSDPGNRQPSFGGAVGGPSHPGSTTTAAGQPHPGDSSAGGVAGVTRSETLSGDIGKQPSLLDSRQSSLNRDSENIQSLEAECQRLRSLAERLENQAQQLESRARSLR